MNSWIDLTALWQIVVVGLIAGAGLPALFAVGLKLISLPAPARSVAVAAGPGIDDKPGTRFTTAEADAPTDPAAGSDTLIGGSMVGLVAGALCFLIILAAIGWGIWAIYQARPLVVPGRTERV